MSDSSPTDDEQPAESGADDRPPAGEPDDQRDARGPDDDGDGRRPDDDGDGRRRFIRWIIAIAIGIPILLEVSTFLGLLRNQLDGGDDDRTPTRTPTPVPSGAGLGDDLLPETPQPDRITAASIVAEQGDTWPFTLTVEVENTGEVPYQVILGEVTTGDGTVVQDSIGTPQLEPGQTRVVENTWEIPAGSQPARIVVEAITFGEETTRTKRAVKLAQFPVTG